MIDDAEGKFPVFTRAVKLLSMTSALLKIDTVFM